MNSEVTFIFWFKQVQQIISHLKNHNHKMDRGIYEYFENILGSERFNMLHIHNKGVSKFLSGN